MNKKILYISLAVASLLSAEEVFTLGEISVIDSENKALDVTKISSETLEYMPEKDTAKVLDTTAGITFEHKGGRNESSIIMRGFDAKRIGVYMDGIPIFVPYDGNFDYSRILTTSLSSIDIAKGFSSSLNGPNAMAGNVNFVSKKPTKEFEGSFTTQANTDNDFHMAQVISSLSVGSKQEKYYVQLDGTYQDRSHFNVSEDFTPTKSQGNGERVRSDSDSKSLNLKVGLTPDSSSEYVLGYNTLRSEKSQPTSVDKTLHKEKYNTWPKWDMDTVYFIANKTFTESALNFKVYRAEYQNTLEEYDDGTFTKLKNIDDTDAHSIGTNLQYSNFGLIEDHVFTLGFNYKKDHHEISRTKRPKEYDDYEDEVYSVALEDIYQATDKLEIVTSFSYDYTDPNYAITEGTELKTKTNNAFNPQIGLFYNTAEDQTTRFTLSRKSHLPTMKERYSTKRGDAIPNPDLDPEIANHIELGHNAQISENLLIDASIFYSHVEDPIVIVHISDSLEQEQNTGTEKYKGFETTINYTTDLWKTGVNYTYLDIDKDGDEVVLGVPKHQAFLFAYYSLIPEVTVGGNLSYKKDIVLDDTVGDYHTVDPIVVANLSAGYVYSEHWDFMIGVENLTDEDYSYNLGYPEKGREYYARFTYNF